MLRATAFFPWTGVQTGKKYLPPGLDAQTSGRV